MPGGKRLVKENVKRQGRKGQMVEGVEGIGGRSGEGEVKMGHEGGRVGGFRGRAESRGQRWKGKQFTRRAGMVP